MVARPAAVFAVGGSNPGQSNAIGGVASMWTGPGFEPPTPKSTTRLGLGLGSVVRVCCSPSGRARDSKDVQLMSSLLEPAGPVHCSLVPHLFLAAWCPPVDSPYFLHMVVVGAGFVMLLARTEGRVGARDSTLGGGLQSAPIAAWGARHTPPARDCAGGNSRVLRALGIHHMAWPADVQSCRGCHCAPISPPASHEPSLREEGFCQKKGSDLDQIWTFQMVTLRWLE